MGEATLENSQRTHESPLELLFTSSTRASLLRVFLLDPLRAYYQRQLEAATGAPLRAVQRELERLASLGLIFRRAEGNRTYYQTDRNHVLYPELRGLVMKCAAPLERLRGMLATDEAVRLAFVDETGTRVLVVGHSGKRPVVVGTDGVTVESVTTEEFLSGFGSRGSGFGNAEGARDDTRGPELEMFLALGADLLGRRDDVIWRHIEAAGYRVAKGAGIP